MRGIKGGKEGGRERERQMKWRGEGAVKEKGRGKRRKKREIEVTHSYKGTSQIRLVHTHISSSHQSFLPVNL